MERELREIGALVGVAAFLLAATLSAAPSTAQQVTGVLGWG